MQTSDQLRDEYPHEHVEERKVVEPVEERRVVEPRNDSLVGYAAIKWTAIAIIVIAILYFFAVYLLPALTGRG